eukprot:Platyproteum_vivax@DN3432_c0_g1_i2.p2
MGTSGGMSQMGTSGGMSQMGTSGGMSQMAPAVAGHRPSGQKNILICAPQPPTQNQLSQPGRPLGGQHPPQGMGQSMGQSMVPQGQPKGAPMMNAPRQLGPGAGQPNRMSYR